MSEPCSLLAAANRSLGDSRIATHHPHLPSVSIRAGEVLAEQLQQQLIELLRSFLHS